MADFLRKNDARVMDVYEIEFDSRSTYLVPARNMSEAIARVVHYVGLNVKIRKVELIRHLALVEVS